MGPNQQISTLGTRQSHHLAVAKLTSYEAILPKPEGSWGLGIMVFIDVGCQNGSVESRLNHSHF